MKKIKYLKHPVSAEQKAKVIADGFKILDIKFKPEDEKPKRKPRKAVNNGTDN